jgi:TM2 domain-containing membrane protein YozV
VSSSANGPDRQSDGSPHEHSDGHSDGQERDGGAPGSTPHGAGQGAAAPEDASPDRSSASDADPSPLKPVARPYLPGSGDPYAQPSSGDEHSRQAPGRDPYAQPSPQNPPTHQSPAQNPYTQGNPQGPYGQPSPAQGGYNQGGYNQAGYNQAGYPQGQYGQPYAPQKSRVVAGVLGILLGSLGIHRFYLGYTTIGVVLVLMSTVGVFLTFGLSAIAAGIWGLVEGILILVGSGSFRTDARGIPLRD